MLQVLKKISHEVKTETELYATDKLDIKGLKQDRIYWMLDRIDLAKEIDEY